MKCLAFAAAVVSIAFLTHSIGRASPVIEEVEPSGADRVLPRLVAMLPSEPSSSLAKSGLSGKVIVTFTVDEKGTVRDAVVTSSPHRQLNARALKVVGAWRFAPGSRNDQPSAFRLCAPVEFEAGAVKAPEIPPVIRRKAPVFYPYDVVMAGQPAWADARFVVDYAGRPLFAVSPAASNKNFAKAVIAMVEASEYFPGKRGAYRSMSAANEHFQFDGELSLDPEARRVLAELRKPAPAIVAVSELTERPKVIHQVSPAYPRALKDDGLTGQAEIEFIVSRDGKVLFPRIVSATHEDFGWAASVAISQWVFQPPQKNGQGVEVRMIVPVLFTVQKLAEAD